MSHMAKLEKLVARLPEATRVDVEAWGGEPTFRVNGKAFIFASPDATRLSIKLPQHEAEAVVATDPEVAPTAYGLGRHGWVTVELPARLSPARWREVQEWVCTSYILVAPKRLARQLTERRHKPGV